MNNNVICNNTKNRVLIQWSYFSCISDSFRENNNDELYRMTGESFTPLAFSQKTSRPDSKKLIAYKNVRDLKHFYFIDITYGFNKIESVNKVNKIKKISHLLNSKILSNQTQGIFTELTKNINCVEYIPIGYKCNKTLIGKNHYFCCITQLKTLEHNPIPITLHVIESPEKNYFISGVEHL